MGRHSRTLGQDKGPYPGVVDIALTTTGETLPTVKVRAYLRSGIPRLGVSTLVLLFAACQPAYQVDLVGTQWSIQSIDGTPVETPTAVLHFGSDGQAADDAVLSLACGDVPLAWVWDTDGSALNLLPGDSSETCREGVSAGDAAVLDAIGGVESWSVQGRDEITLKGERELHLSRVASSGSAPSSGERPTPPIG
jgi:hypothetical protein